MQGMETVRDIYHHGESKMLLERGHKRCVQVLYLGNHVPGLELTRSKPMALIFMFESSPYSIESFFIHNMVKFH
uniref:Uncharacterized protein n=1 Tax=Picea glauca TaxID=3330 RepID=A0A101LTM4_PICGL|nr:hypothetical protein ABT39_MTgene3637 [Picea glauca]